MSQFDKLLARIRNLDKNMRFDELRKILEYYGYTMHGPSGGAAIRHSASPGVFRLRFRYMSQLSGLMSNSSKQS